MGKLALSLLILLLVYAVFKETEITHPPGMIAPNTPVQVKIQSAPSFDYEGYAIFPLAKFHAKARVLSRENYYFGRQAKLSPIDLALGWGPMSNDEFLENISISQSNRWYRWRTKDFSIRRTDIERNSANMHLIPANQEVKDRLKKTKKGSLVEFSGYLVKVKTNDNWEWASSLTRNDTGSQACELVWVEEFSIH
ncbi:MAG: hypothetical protein OEU36_17935 [Gammaproteobacteria bacterium]|nr:hypothetical protein [Gammaproteobacteria bacterium]